MEASRGRKGSDNTWERARSLSATGLRTWRHGKKSGSMGQKTTVLRSRESEIFCTCVLTSGNTPGAGGLHDVIIREGKEKAQDSAMSGKLAREKTGQNMMAWRLRH
jgi:hypothetical protein